MRYQVDPTDQTPDNGLKHLFWLFGSFKNAFLWSLNDPSWPGNVAESWKTFSTITICNIKSTQQTKLMKMAKNLFFGALDHSKMHFFDFWMIQHDQKLLTPFSTIIICNIESIRGSTIEIMAKTCFMHN